MRLTNTASLGAALRNSVGRAHNKLHIALSTYGVRSLTSGTYRVPKAFNEPNVCLFSKAYPTALQITDSIVAAL
jgi:hypothetical protein